MSRLCQQIIDEVILIESFPAWIYSNIIIICCPVTTTILPSTTVIRSRKPRLRIEKSAAKTPDSSHLVVDMSPEVVEFYWILLLSL